MCLERFKQRDAGGNDRERIVGALAEDFAPSDGKRFFRIFRKTEIVGAAKELFGAVNFTGGQ